MLILLDQFEEYFLYHGECDTDFDSEFAAAVNDTESQAGFAVALRDDWLSRLDRFDARIPNLLSNNLRLEHLTTAAAEEAIRKPLEVYNRNFPNGAPITIEDELVHAILPEVQAGKFDRTEFGGAGQTKTPRNSDRIEAAFLQLVMERLWEVEINENQSRVLRLSTFDRLGRANRIVEGHLRNVMEELSPQDQKTCARIFPYLVTPGFKKIAHETADLANWAGAANADAIRPLLTSLERKRVLRRIFPPERYEILHDVLGRAVLDWRASYVQTEARAEAEKEAARQAIALRHARQRAAVYAVIALFAIAAAIYALVQRKDAEREAQANSAHELVTNAYSSLARDPERSILLSLRAASILQRLHQPFPRELIDALNRSVQSSHLRQTLWPGSVGEVYDINLSSDGKLLATAGSRGDVKLWDVASPHIPLHILPGDGKAVISTSFSRDGTMLVTADTDGDVILWDTATGKRKWQLPTQADSVRLVALSQDARWLAAGGENGTITLVDGASGHSKSWPAHKKTLTALQFSPDASRLASAAEDSYVAKIWDVHSAHLLNSLTGHTEPIGAITFSPDGKRLAAGSNDDSVRVWDLTSGAKPLTLSSDSEIFGVSFDPAGTRLAVGCFDGTATVWDLHSGHKLLTLAGHKGLIQTIAFGPEGKTLLTGSWDRTVKIWNIPLVHSDSAMDVAFSPDGNRVATVSRDHSVKLWDANAENALLTIPGSSGELVGVAFSPDGTRIATSGRDKWIKTFDAASGRKLQAWFAGDVGGGLSFSPDSQRLATPGPGNTAEVWDANSGKPLLALRGDYNDVNDVGFSADGKLLATAGLDWTVRIWDASSGNQLHMLGEGGHQGACFFVAFSPNAPRLVAGFQDKTALIWDYLSGKTLRLVGHDNAVFGVAFSHDGRRVATGSLDRTARVWDAVTGKELLRFNHPRAVESVSFSPDGKRLATVSDDGMVRVFILDPNELLRVARTRVTRSWTKDECAEYLHQTSCPPDLTQPPR